MKRSLESSNRVTVVGIDGSGKSTAAHEAALQLSEEYPTSDIRVVDSAGIVHYREGGVTERKFPEMEALKASEGSSRLESIGRTVLFTAKRRAAESLSLQDRHALTIGVRDPYRVDLATYLPLFVRQGDKISPKRRLALFHGLATAVHPALINLLSVDPQKAYEASVNRGVLDSHETLEGLAQAAEDLTQVVEAYSRTFGVRAAHIEALRPDTSDALAMNIEEFVPGARKS